jgi:hypothetical protein
MSPGFRRLALRRAAALVTVVALAATPQLAYACAVCGGGNPANRFAFFASTMALSLLPLGLFAGGFLWLRSRIRARFADEFTEREPVTTTVAAGPSPLPATTAPYSR